MICNLLFRMILLFVNILILGELLQDVSANEQGNFANVINNNNINGWNKDVRKIRNVVSKGIINF